MFTFPRFIGCACTLGLAFCITVATPLSTLATDIVPVTDTWIPLPDAWDTVAPFYDNYNNALSTDSGVTITADTYDEYVFRSVIGNWVATNSAFGEDVSLNGIIDVLQADTDYYNYLLNQIQVNPINASYRFGESAGASLRAFLGDMLEDTFGLTDIMTTSEAVGLDFPVGRVFVKRVLGDGIITVGNWLYVPYGESTAPLEPTAYDYNYSDGYYHLETAVPNGIYMTYVANSSYNMFYIATKETVAPAYNTLFLKIGYYTYSSSDGWNNFLTTHTAYYPVGGYIYRDNRWINESQLGSLMKNCLVYNGCTGYTDVDTAIADLYGGTPSGGEDFTEPIVVINDNEPPIISPTSVYNDWSTISNNNYNTYNTDYITYNTGDSIYNYTYYYTINNYSNDMPLWVVNGKNLPVYDFDRETFYDFSNQNYTVSDDLVWDSSFFDFVWENLPAELVGLLLTMLIASAFFLLFRH